MPLPVVVKLLAAKDKAGLDAAIAAYTGGAPGNALLTDQRAMDMAAYRDPADDKTAFFVALAHGGDDTPAAKVADQQFIVVEDDDLAQVQTKLDAAIAAAVHHRRTDGDANTNAGDINVGAAMFAAGDVGRTITIGANVRTITAFTSATRVTYSGAAITGTGLTVQLHGAECVQDLKVAAFKERDADPHYVVMMAVEGQLE